MAILVAPRWRPSSSRSVLSQAPPAVCSICSHPLDLGGWAGPPDARCILLCTFCQPMFPELADP
jgi:hypothetical protein